MQNIGIFRALQSSEPGRFDYQPAVFIKLSDIPTVVVVVRAMSLSVILVLIPGVVIVDASGMVMDLLIPLPAWSRERKTGIRRA